MVRGRRGAATAATAIVAVGLVVGGCGAGGGSGDDVTGGSDSTATGDTAAPTGRVVEIAGKEFSYDPAVVALEAGEPVTIVLRNIGSIEHDITVDEGPGFKLTVTPGEEGRKALAPSEPGTYKFYCSIPGHESAGMRGEITVE